MPTDRRIQTANSAMTYYRCLTARVDTLTDDTIPTDIRQTTATRLVLDSIPYEYISEYLAHAPSDTISIPTIRAQYIDESPKLVELPGVSEFISSAPRELRPRRIMRPRKSTDSTTII